MTNKNNNLGRRMTDPPQVSKKSLETLLVGIALGAVSMTVWFFIFMKLAGK